LEKEGRMANVGGLERFVSKILFPGYFNTEGLESGREILMPSIMVISISQL